MMLPRKRKPAGSGIERAPKREWPRHRKFVRSHACCVPGCTREPIEFAHIRSAANSGTGIKPHDAFGISLCHAHHREQHLLGQPEFEKQYRIDLGKLATEFARRSPDTAMRESLALVPAEEAEVTEPKRKTRASPSLIRAPAERPAPPGTNYAWDYGEDAGKRPAPEESPAIKTHTCPKCGAQGVAFICSEPGCPVNGGAAYGPAPEGLQPIPREIMARILAAAPVPPTGRVELGERPNTESSPTTTSATPPSSPAVVDYTERAGQLLRDLGIADRHAGAFPGDLRLVIAAAAAIASEHQAEIEALKHDIGRTLAIASSEAAGHSEALASLARLREPEMRVAIKRALAPYLHDAITIQARDDAADAILAVITRRS